MAVMGREAWTDERLDDLNAKVDQGFRQVDQRFDRVEVDIRELRSEVKGDVSEVKGDVKDLRSEMKQGFDSLQRTMMIGFVTLFASISASMIGVVLSSSL
jgi:hypothetical protein